MAFKVERKIDRKNLLRELANNKVDALEIIREALSNARDHGAGQVWIRTYKGPAPEHRVDVFLYNDGEGMPHDQLEAFWGISTSVKSQQNAIGYKGHGTKLFFACSRLSVATRCSDETIWRLTQLQSPHDSDAENVDILEMPANHKIAAEFKKMGHAPTHGVAILIEGCLFRDASDRFFSRRAIESYCDWFTVVGDVRSGLFNTRKEWHEFIHEGKDWTSLRDYEVPIRPILVHLCINGEKTYSSIGFGATTVGQEFLNAWPDDVDAWKTKAPELVAFGHRFADHFESRLGARTVKDDRTALGLIKAADFAGESQYALIMRVEGQRRQVETYREATRTGVANEYRFDDRFGLWLCKDFIPIAQRNDLLSAALSRATERVKKRFRFELGKTRFWQIFVNHQSFVLTANRNELANAREHEDKIIELVAQRITTALEEDAFAEWIENLQTAVVHEERTKELRAMSRRVESITEWFKKSGHDVNPAHAMGLERLDEGESLRMPMPQNEQEVFQLYTVLSGIYRVPLRLLEYNTNAGIDAIAQVRAPEIFDKAPPYARVEFKHILRANRAIGHFFDAIDAFICWSSEVGPLPEAGDSPTPGGEIRPRKPPRHVSGCDTHQVETTDANGVKRILPVLTLEKLFPSRKKGR